MATKQQIQIAAKLYECRDTARRITRDSYGPIAQKWMTVISSIADNLGIDFLNAGQRVAVAAASENDDVGLMWALAATVELIEPDELTPEVTNG